MRHFISTLLNFLECRSWKNSIHWNRSEALIQLIMIFASLVLEGIVCELCRCGLNHINQWSYSNWNLYYIFVTSAIYQNSRKPSHQLKWYSGKDIGCLYPLRTTCLGWAVVSYIFSVFRQIILYDISKVCWCLSFYAHLFLISKALKGAWCILPGGFSEWEGSNNTFRRYFYFTRWVVARGDKMSGLVRLGHELKKSLTAWFDACQVEPKHSPS